MTGWPRRGGYQRLVDRWLDRLYQHVRLVYPFADTDDTVREVFSRALTDGSPSDAPGERAWLYGLARAVVYAEPGDDDQVRRRNAEAIAFELHDALDVLSGDSRINAAHALRALAVLTSEEQEILRLHAVEALDPAELGWVLGLDAEHAFGLVTAASDGLSRAVDDPPSQSERGVTDA